MDLQSKLETALKTLLETISVNNRGNASVTTGLNYAALTPPYIVAVAQQGEEMPLDSGNFYLNATVEVFSAADPKSSETLEAHRSRAEYVFEKLLASTLAADLSALADFHCFGIRNRAFMPEREQDRQWVTGLQFQAYCCGKDMA